MAANKRIRPRRPKTSKELAAESGHPQKSRQPPRKPREIEDEIHRLECFIAAAPHIKKRQRLARIDLVPAMELETVGARRPARLLHHQKRALTRHRFRLLAELGIVAIAIAGLAGWLNQCFHLIR